MYLTRDYCKVLIEGTWGLFPRNAKKIKFGAPLV